VTWAGWLLAVAAAVVISLGYRYSLSRRPTRNCHRCGGRGWHRGWLWWYAKGPCTGRTVLPPRAPCERGQVPRYGRRVLRLEDKGK
jgi:hypothetical protein